MKFGREVKIHLLFSVFVFQKNLQDQFLKAKDKFADSEETAFTLPHTFFLVWQCYWYQDVKVLLLFYENNGCRKVMSLTSLVSSLLVM